MGNKSTKVLVDTLNDINRERITNILSRNTVSLSNVINASQSIIVNIRCGNNCKVCPNGFVIEQNQTANVNVVTNVSQSQVNEIANLIEAELENKTSQTYNEVAGFLAVDLSLGKNTEITTKIINRLKDVVRNDITLENITSVMNQVNFSENSEINIIAGNDFEFGAKGCDITQNIFIDFTSKAIIDMVAKNAMEDQSLVRMVNDARQDTQIEAKGLDDLVKSIFSGLAGVVVVGVIVLVVILKMQSSILPTDSLTEAAKKNPKTAIFAFLIMFIVIGCIMYFPVAKIFGMWPFAGERTLWKCEMVDGKHTGKCVSGVFEKGFKSKEECEMSKLCTQYWGCEMKDGSFTGRCAEYTSAIAGPMRSKKECEEAVAAQKMCTLKFGGKLAADGTYAEPAECVQYEDPKMGIYKTKKQCEENISRFKNRWKCNGGSCAKVHPSTEWALYSSEQECKKSCKSE